MSGKYGSSSFSVFLADGYNLLAAKVKNVSHKVTSILQQSDGLGDRWREHSPTGVREATLTQQGAFFDDATAIIHDAWKADQQTSRIVCFAWAGNVIGQLFKGLQGT